MRRVFSNANEEKSGSFADQQKGKGLSIPNLWTLSAAISLLATSGVLLFQLTRVRAREAIVEVRTLEVRSPIEGLITNLEVKAGDRVYKGQELFSTTNSLASKTRIADLKIELAAAEAKLRVIQLQEERAKRLLANSNIDFNRQSRLQISRQKEELNVWARKHQQALQEASFAERHYARRKDLYAQGAIAFDEVDRAGTSLSQAKEEVRLSKNKIKAQQQVLEAAQNNLTLIATRGGSDPETLIKDLGNKFEITQEEKRTQLSVIRELQNQLRTALHEYEITHFAKVFSPINGVVWSIDYYPGSGIKEQETVLRLLDCSDRWINTYVREGDIKHLYIGQNAEVSLYGSNYKLKGRVSLIRSGIGRSSIGSDVTPVLPINIYRESQVKVTISNHVSSLQNPGNLCLSGFTGKVTFLK